MNCTNSTDILHLWASALLPRLLAMAGSRPAEDGWESAPVPQFLEAKEIPGSRGYLQDDLARGPHDLGGHIDHLAAQGRGGTTPGGQRLCTHLP